MLARKLLLLYCRACEDRRNFMLPGSMFMGVPGVHILASNVGIHLNIVRVIVRTYEWDSVIWWHLPQGTWCVLFMHWGLLSFTHFSISVSMATTVVIGVREQCDCRRV